MHELMMLRVLYVMVLFSIIPALIFQTDETACLLLDFGSHGCADVMSPWGLKKSFSHCSISVKVFHDLGLGPG